MSTPSFEVRLIIFSEVARRIMAEEPVPTDVQHVLRSLSVRYPDESLEIRGDDNTRLVSKFVADSNVFLDSVEQGIFRALSPFGRIAYLFSYPLWYHRFLGKLGFVMGVPHGAPVVDSERQLHDVMITVKFKRRPNDRVRWELVRTVADWAAEVCVAGMDGEGPAQLVSDHVAFIGRVAQFSVDLSSSGPTTVNWLLLSIGNLGFRLTEGKNAVEDITVDQAERFGVMYPNDFEGKRIVLRFDGK